MSYQNFNNQFLKLKFLYGIIASMLSFPVWGQVGQFGNEWLQNAGNAATSNQFYKLKVVEDGVYRVTYQELDDAGFVLSSVSPNNFQIWRRGVQQSIIVNDNGDGSFDSGDYIEFFGKGNDGQLDKYLYFDTTHHVQKGYSAYTDTAAYIITLGTGASRTTEINGVSSSYGTFDTTETVKINFPVADRYHYGKYYFKDKNGTRYEPMAFGDVGEGWFGKNLGTSGRTYTLGGLEDVIATNGNATLKITMVSTNNVLAQTLVRYKTTSDGSYTTLDTIYSNNYTATTTTYSLPVSQIVDPTNDGKFTIQLKRLLGDNAVCANIYLEAPRKNSINSNSQFFTINGSTGTDKSIQLENGTPSTYIYDITEEGNFRKITCEYISGTPSYSQAKYPQLNSEENLFVSNEYKSIAGIEKFTYFNPDTLAEYLIISHERLTSSANDYKNYRQSPDGGNYRVELRFTDEIYNTFCYGDYNPLAIRRYCDYQTSLGNAEFLFLIGKGFINVGIGSEGGAIYAFSSSNIFYRKRDASHTNSVTRLGYTAELEDLVPSAGVPGSDIWYSSKLDPGDNSWAPKLGTGRLSALTNEEVTAYLDKVIEYEQVPDTTAWKKEILHLAGGYSESEIAQISNAVDAWKVIAEGEHFGGNVSTISRPKLNNQTNVSQINVSDQVNKGLHLMTFFGHSDYTITDIDIGKASDPINQYTNKDGKYPLILLNGCNSGNCYVRSFTFGEDWVNVAQKGAIGFIGHSDIGLTSSLSVYTNNFYRTMFRDTNFITAPLGILMNEAIRKQISGNTPGLQVAHALQMVLQGDPAIQLFKASKPDLAVSNNSLFLEEIDGGGITAVSEAVNLGIIVRNYGLYNGTDSFFVSVRRKLADGTTLDYKPKKYGSVKRLDTIYFEIGSNSIDAFGINEFMVHIDYNYDSVSALGGAPVAFNQSYEAQYEKGVISEVHETNNEAYFQYYLPLSTVRPIFPKEFSIVNNDYYFTNGGVNFTAISTDLLVTSESYYIEVDTNRNFTSPLYTGVENGTSIVTWKNVPLVSLVDTTVYYWRVRFNNIPEGTDTLWEESSFTYISNSSEGWSQAHFQQFFRDIKTDIMMNPASRKWDFDKIQTDINIKLSNPANYSNTSNSVVWNNQTVFFNCDVGVRLFVVNPVTLLPESMPLFDAYSCQSQGQKYHYRFNLTNSGHVTAFQSLINSLQDNYIVVISNMKNCPFATWETNSGIGSFLSSKFGTSQYPNNDTSAYAMVGCKNCNIPIFEAIHPDTIIEDVTITATKEGGSVVSTIIGPSLGWDEFHRNIQKSYAEATDAFELDVFGLDLDLNDSLVIDNIAPGNIDLSTIDAKTFPYLRLEIQKSDPEYRTPPQLNNWLVLYDNRIPEGMLVTDGYDYSKKEYYEGQSLNYTFKFRNISDYDFTEPLVVSYAFSTSQQFTELRRDTLPGILKAGEEIEFEFNYAPSGTFGDKLLQVFVNPRLQVEEYYYNNIWQIPLSITQDNINPLLDVAFDGVHIMNYDIISPTPEIVMAMKDDNQHRLKTDTTTGIEIYWKYPGQSVYTIIDIMNNPQLDFTTASENQDFKVTYRPEKLEDGIHYLAVNMADASGNFSGVFSYEIAFEVVNEASISRFYPYPNPFSTSTRFAYTLTGSEQPDNIRIQIMTLSGKMIREINAAELGPLRIGKHLTDYAWDGTDEFGDKLANGVYLYRVLTEIDGESIKERTANSFTDANTFTKDWGKLYIMR